MALDRFVYFRQGKKPTREEIRLVLEDYLSGSALEILWERDRFFVTLVGQNTHPLRRMANAPDRVRLDPEPGFEGRHLEVWLDYECIDVITREADEYTSAVAGGIAKLVARFWQGDLEGG